ncbi:IS3 family transposase [Rodentibacter haemolyticus]|uniref:IS3 family transposase n=1 Tax=Rodentibacter haemolyticus TaxID=2778911 RepID=A0ABX6UUU7_9PAST|nr:IS3 family transposase [Rodentibacter haemolyticus]
MKEHILYINKERIQLKDLSPTQYRAQILC